MTVNAAMIRAMSFAVFLLSSAHALALDQMQFSVQVSSPALSVSHDLETRLRITNRSQKPMYVYQDLGYYVSVFAYNGSGKSLAKEFIDEIRPPPPERSSFTLLKPGKYIEYVRHDSLGDLGIHKAGQYRIDFTYNMQMVPPFTYSFPVWMGTQKQSAMIRVVDPHTRNTHP